MVNSLESLTREFFVKNKKIEYKKGQMIIRAEEEPAGVYYLEKGFVKMTSIFENGNELILNIFKPSSFFPMIWAISNKTNSYYFEAIQDSILYKSPRKKVLKFILENPKVLYDLTKRMLTGFDGLLVNIQHLLSGGSEERVAFAILICAKRFGKKDSKRGVSIELPLTHQDIANLAGITRETASLAIEKLRKQDLVEQVGRKFVVKNIGALEKRSEITVAKIGSTIV